MVDVLMPRLSDSMQEGTILRWLKADGVHIVAGQEIVEIETDKATMVHEAEASGSLQILAAEGSTVPVGERIASITEAEQSGAQSIQLGTDEVEPFTPPGDRANASPSARRLAESYGADLRSIKGSGPGGRIVKADVEAKVLTARASTQGPPPPSRHRRQVPFWVEERLGR
jgi:pyruvate dehydrogenase E2 component (dihydrolipoamide acetyltransferase)